MGEEGGGAELHAVVMGWRVFSPRRNPVSYFGDDEGSIHFLLWVPERLCEIDREIDRLHYSRRVIGAFAVFSAKRIFSTASQQVTPKYHRHW